MKLLLVVVAVSAFVFFESDAACNEPFPNQWNLASGNSGWWNDSSSTHGIWQNALSPAGGSGGWLVVNGPMGSVTFRQQFGYCFVVKNLCIKSKGARKCTITFDCPSQPELQNAPPKFVTCVNNSCRALSVTIKCWRKKPHGKFKFSVKRSEVCFLDSDVCP